MLPCLGLGQPHKGNFQSVPILPLMAGSRKACCPACFTQAEACCSVLGQVDNACGTHARVSLSLLRRSATTKGRQPHCHLTPCHVCPQDAKGHCTPMLTPQNIMPVMRFAQSPVLPASRLPCLQWGAQCSKKGMFGSVYAAYGQLRASRHQVARRREGHGSSIGC